MLHFDMIPSSMTERAGEGGLPYKSERRLGAELLSHLRIGAQALSEVGLTVNISDPLDSPRDGALSQDSVRVEISAVNGGAVISLWSVHASVEHVFHTHLHDDPLVRERAMVEAAQRAAISIKSRMDKEAAKKADQA